MEELLRHQDNTGQQRELYRAAAVQGEGVRQEAAPAGRVLHSHLVADGGTTQTSGQYEPAAGTVQSCCRPG